MTTPIVPVLGRRESIYLDLVRSLAAFFVVLDHAPTLFDLPNVPRWGHQAVVIFFVLSGYVISHVADARDTTLSTFLVARLARLWSVLVPAMALTIGCDVIGRTFGHNMLAYALAPVDLPAVRIGAALGFVSESWVSIQPLSNGVIWSLCAEFWYYVLFAVWNFLPVGRARITALIVVALFSGHKALLLLPIWLMGVALQRSREIRRFAPSTNLALWAGGLLSVIWVLATRAYDPAIRLMESLVSPWEFTQLAQARVFWFDWIFGLAVTAHLLGARTVISQFPIERISRPVRWCAGVSFAAYLFHMPLLHLWAAFLPRDRGWLAIALTFAVIATLGHAVEQSKTWWRRNLSALADRLTFAAAG